MSSDPTDSEEGRRPVLSADELDISNDENVTEIEEGRYVISTGNAPPPDSMHDQDRSSTDEQSDSDRSIDEQQVNEWLTAHLDDLESQYGFTITAKFDDDVGQRKLVSNNIVTVFEQLVLWYAQQVSTDTPVEEVLGILLTESSVEVTYPSDNLVALLDRYGLTREDSIDDLLRAVREDNDGFSL